MNQVELSLLAFLVEAVIVSTSSEQLKQIVERLPHGKSDDFDAALKVLRNVAKGLHPNSATGDRLAELDNELKKLALKQDEASKSVAEALEWALSNWRSRKLSAR